MRKRTVGVILAAVLAFSSLAGCGTAEGKNKNTASEKVFTYARSDSVTSFDLHEEITSNNAYAIDKVFETLVTFDNEGNITDWLAASHEVSDDGLTYTFTLRDGVKFSDGNALTADDVVFSINRHLEVGGALPIEADVQSVEAADEKTVKITLGTAYTPFISELANFSNGILENNYGGKTEEEYFQNPVGTGPFVVSDWDPSGDLTFVKNTYYWQEGKPYIDKLIYKVVDSDATALQMLQSGEVQGIESLSPANASSVANGADTTVVASSNYEVEEVFFNTLDEHFSDVHVRRALAMAIDREALTQALTFGYATVSNTVLPESIQYQTNDTVEALSYDVEAAKAELAESAYPNGFETTISVPSGADTEKQEAQIIIDAASKIGITITLDETDTATFRSNFMSLNFSIMINSATADFPDADSIFAFQCDPEGWSQCYWTSYNSEEAAALMKEGQTAPDGEERASIYAELQQLLADEVPFIPLYNIQNVVGISSKVTNFTLLPNGSVRFEDADFTD